MTNTTVSLTKSLPISLVKVDHSRSHADALNSIMFELDRNDLDSLLCLLIVADAVVL